MRIDNDELYLNEKEFNILIENMGQLKFKIKRPKEAPHRYSPKGYTYEVADVIKVYEKDETDITITKNDIHIGVNLPKESLVSFYLEGHLCSPFWTDTLVPQIINIIKDNEMHNKILPDGQIGVAQMSDAELKDIKEILASNPEKELTVYKPSNLKNQQISWVPAMDINDGKNIKYKDVVIQYALGGHHLRFKGESSSEYNYQISWTNLIPTLQMEGLESVEMPITINEEDRRKVVLPYKEEKRIEEYIKTNSITVYKPTETSECPRWTTSMNKYNGHTFAPGELKLYKIDKTRYVLRSEEGIYFSLLWTDLYPEYASKRVPVEAKVIIEDNKAEITYSEEEADRIISKFEEDKKSTRFLRIRKPKHQTYFSKWFDGFDQHHGKAYSLKDLSIYKERKDGRYHLLIKNKEGDSFKLEWTNYNDYYVDFFKSYEPTKEIVLDNQIVRMTNKAIDEFKTVFRHNINFRIRRPKEKTNGFHHWIPEMDKYDGKEINTRYCSLHVFGENEVYFSYEGCFFNLGWSDFLNESFRPEFEPALRKVELKPMKIPKLKPIVKEEPKVEEDEGSWGGIFAALAFAGGLAAVKSKKKEHKKEEAQQTV